VSLEAGFFYVVGAAAIASALVMVLHRNPVISAISLIGNFFCLALLYLMLQAQLLAVLQVVVYTGAIMVLVIFVIMLLNLGDEKRLTEKYDLKKIAGVAIAVGFSMEMIYIIGLGDSSAPGPAISSGQVGSVDSMGDALFGRFLLPFEVTSLLLLAAIIGAVVLARREN
jgi:NADH-quinone oxidoreductase subunit J